jgi:hypothetical protein
MSLELKINSDAPDILEVIETIPSFHTSTITYWYYNIRTWEVSSNGKQGDIPDRQMTPSSIDWVKKYYLSRLNKEL